MGESVNELNPSERRSSSRWSRRRFLGFAGAALLGSLRSTWDSRADESRPPIFLLEWGRRGKEEGEFSACVGVAVGKDDEIYTSEFRNQRVQRFTPEGKFLSTFPVQPHAGGLAVDPKGNVYVAHWNSNKIAAYSPAGELLREWGQKGTADGEFQLPGSIALGPDGLLYVPDQGNSRIQKFTTDGRFVGKWGEHGKEPGQFGGGEPPGGRFAGPQFIAFDRAGNAYVTDVAVDRIQKFTADGKLLDFWGSDSSEPGGFGPPPLGKDGKPIQGGPIAICVDSRDRVWVSATNNRVQQFTNDGKYIRGLGGAGEGPGQFHLPHGIALDSRGCLYVSDTMNSRIQKFDAG
jgi:sugar lactone lactonase YvrE